MDVESDIRSGRKPRGFKSGNFNWKFWQVSKQREGNGLGKRINGRNARFYAPGLARPQKTQGLSAERMAVHEFEMAKIRAAGISKEDLDVKEVRRPGKVFAKWKRDVGY